MSYGELEANLVRENAHLREQNRVLREALVDFRDHGLRFDLNPTYDFNNPHVFFHEYTPRGGEMSHDQRCGTTTMNIAHEILPEGESTEKWAIRSPGFLGSIRQLVHCARCGEPLRGGPNSPQHFRDIFKPTAHFLCIDCYNALPD